MIELEWDKVSWTSLLENHFLLKEMKIQKILITKIRVIKDKVMIIDSNNKIKIFISLIKVGLIKMIKFNNI